jgi:hypothetical protein
VIFGRSTICSADIATLEAAAPCGGGGVGGGVIIRSPDAGTPEAAALSSGGGVGGGSGDGGGRYCCGSNLAGSSNASEKSWHW